MGTLWGFRCLGKAPDIALDKVGQLIFSVRRNVCKLDTHAGCIQAAGGSPPDNAGVNGYGRVIARQTKNQGNHGINRKGFNGMNKSAAGAQVGYTAIRREV